LAGTVPSAQPGQAAIQRRSWWLPEKRDRSGGRGIRRESELPDCHGQPFDAELVEKLFFLLKNPVINNVFLISMVVFSVP
jgi:hypothetical protein